MSVTTALVLVALAAMFVGFVCGMQATKPAYQRLACFRQA